MKFSANTIVVDADIAFSAGGSDHPTSKKSRLVLQTILSSNLNVAFCKNLSAEWKKHGSSFACKWLSSMVAKKRCVRIAAEDVIQLDIENAGLSEADVVVALKDAHVVNNALKTDRFITSNDKAARRVYLEVSKSSGKLNEVSWVVPMDDCEDLLRLFKDGGFIPPKWLLKISDKAVA